MEVSGGGRWLALLAVGEAVHIAGWAAYYTLTRMVYAGDDRFLYALSAAETLPTALGLLGARLSSRHGYRASLLVGVAEGLLLALAGLSLGSKPLLWLLALAASAAWSIAGGQLYGYVLAATGGSGEAYATVSAGATLGWSIGSLAPLSPLSPGETLVLAGLAVAAFYLAAASTARDQAPAGGGGGGAPPRLIAAGLAAAAGFYTASEVVGSIYMGRLAEAGGAAAYSAANAAAGLSSAAARLAAGRIADRTGPWTPLFLGVAAYAAYIIALDRAPQSLLPILWVLPLHALADTPLGLALAEALGESLGAAVATSAYSISGAAMLLASLANPPPLPIALLGLAASAASASALHNAARRRLEGGRGTRMREERPRRRPRQ